MILQTLQQLRDVYGDSVDKVVQGNAAPLDSLVATPDGWKRMGDIQVGDEVLTPFGTVTTVTGVYPKGIRPVYRVTLRDGSSSEVCHQHLWQIERYKTSLIYNGTDENGKKIYSRPESGLTCELIQEVIDTDELKRRVDNNWQINLPKIKPMAYSEKKLPIHPYVLGVIIGDANINTKGRVILTVSDKDVQILYNLHTYGYETTQICKSANKTPSYYIKNISEAVRKLGLNGHRAWEKFIPDMYLYGSVEQRIDLLRGLMDTDGTISKKGKMEFTSSSRVLAEQVQFLIRSLGGRVALHVKNNVTYTSPNQPIKKKARPAYRLQNIRLFDINPFSLSRKAERWHERLDNSGNRIVSVEYVRDEEVQCIRVADDRHLYIMNDCMPTHNTSNIVFLKSTDDAMLETLQKMSGITHKSFTDSKTITRDAQKIMMKNEGKASYTMTTKEMPVISFNDMAFISERNSIVFRAGDSPVWNRNETILPMSWRLFKNTITQPGKDYSLQTIPTLSSALDFDIKQNQPDFIKMLDKRIAQAVKAKDAEELYKNAYKYTDAEYARLDIDAKSDEIMDLIVAMLNDSLGKMTEMINDDDDEFGDDDVVNIDDWDDDMLRPQYVDDVDSIENYGSINSDDIEENEDVQAEAARRQAERSELDRKVYAGGFISKSMLVNLNGTVKHSFDKDFSEIFANNMGVMLSDSAYFKDVNGDLYGLNGSPYIVKTNNQAVLDAINKAAQDDETRTYSDGDISEADLNEFNTYTITDAFYQFLVSMDAWTFAGGRFDDEMRRRMEG